MRRRSQQSSAHVLVSLLLLTFLLVACSDDDVSNATVIPTVVPPTATTSASPQATTAPTASVAQATATVTPTAIPTMATSTGEPPVYGYRVVATFPHDPAAFTQGLDIDAGSLYEGTGTKGSSSLRRVDLETGEVRQQIDLESQYFGEGIVVFGDRIVQLTWDTQVAFVYDRETFELLDTLAYPTEGWGITSDGQQLIMSDGSNMLFFRDPETFAERSRIEVIDGDEPVRLLNELEWVNGEVWANVWSTDRIVRIDPATGAVLGWIDLTGLLQPEDLAGGAVDVLNGIAIDEDTGQIYVTGKLWPVIYEIELVAP